MGLVVGNFLVLRFLCPAISSPEVCLVFCVCYCVFCCVSYCEPFVLSFFCPFVMSPSLPDVSFSRRFFKEIIKISTKITC